MPEHLYNTMVGLRDDVIMRGEEEIKPDTETWEAYLDYLMTPRDKKSTYFKGYKVINPHAEITSTN